MKTARTAMAGAIAAHTRTDGLSKDYARQIAALLMADGRVGELNSLLRDVQADWAQAGYVEVLAYSAHPLTAASKADIAAQLQPLFPGAERLVVTEVIDPAIVGSVKLRLAHQQLDLSVEAKLNKFKQLVRAGKE